MTTTFLALALNISTKHYNYFIELVLFVGRIKLFCSVFTMLCGVIMLILVNEIIIIIC